MEYYFKEWVLQELINVFEQGRLELSPPYQRGDIWTLPAKKKLIDSIKSKYPLPIFFLYEKSAGAYEMVDGQQRTRTIVGYSKGLFPDLNREKLAETDKGHFLNEYNICVCIITKAGTNEIEDFYFRVNKFGTKLNRPEILKAQYANTNLQVLVEKISESNEFETLRLFKDKSLERLNDLDFIAELLTLLKFGITERKFAVDKFYETKEFSQEDSKELEQRFNSMLKIITRLNEIYPIMNTRYKQRSDFYTLFSFISLFDSEQDFIDEFYKILVVIGDDISPSNEKCFALQDYAINCVSLSHTEKARKMRLKFFEHLLLNEDSEPLKNERNSILMDVMLFYNQLDTDLEKNGVFYNLNVGKIQNITNRKYF